MTSTDAYKAWHIIFLKTHFRRRFIEQRNMRHYRFNDYCNQSTEHDGVLGGIQDGFSDGMQDELEEFSRLMINFDICKLNSFLVQLENTSFAGYDCLSRCR